MKRSYKILIGLLVNVFLFTVNVFANYDEGVEIVTQSESIKDESEKSVISESATVTIVEDVIKELKITEQPKDVATKAGEAAKFSITAVGKGLTYQWQYMSVGGKGWGNLSGGTSATLTKYPPATWNGWKIRCVIKDETGKTVISESATVTIVEDVIEELKIIEQPENVLIRNSQASTTFRVVAQGNDLQYKWQYCYSGGVWTDFPSQSKSVLSCSVYNRDGFAVRCIVSDRYGNSVRSQSAIIMLDDDGANITGLDINFLYKNITNLGTTTKRPLMRGVIVSPTNYKGKLYWVSDNTDVVSVNSKGIITANGLGNACVKVQSSTGVSATINICVNTKIGIDESLPETICGEKDSVKELQVSAYGKEVVDKNYIINYAYNVVWEYQIKGSDLYGTTFWDIACPWMKQEDGYLFWENEDGSVGFVVNEVTNGARIRARVEYETTDSLNQRVAYESNICTILMSEEISLNDNIVNMQVKGEDKTNKKDYTVIYDACEGSFVNGDVKLVETVSKGYYSIESEEPIREGFVFEGWSLDGKIVNDMEVESDVILYAVWSEKLTITKQLESQSIYEGDCLSLQVEVNQLGVQYQWEKLVNDQWEPIDQENDSQLVIENLSIDNNGDEYRVVISNGDSEVVVSSIAKIVVLTQDSLEETVDAIKEDYTVIYDACEGSFVNGDVKFVETVSKGYYAIESEEPIREGFVFEGWSLDGKIVNDMEVESDVILYAVWSEKLTITKQLESQSIYEGDCLSLQVEVNQLGVQYQWEKLVNDQWEPIDQENDSQLVIENLSIDNNGDEYRVVISNGDSEVVVSSIAKIVVLTQDSLEETVEMVN